MSGKGGPTFDKERVSFNIARLRKGGAVFELALDPDKAILYKRGKISDPVEVVRSEKIFSDVKKGLESPESDLERVFKTTKFKEVARKVLDEGRIQFTSKYREQMRKEKMNKLINKIHRNAINPKTDNPHPEKRIKLALEEANVKLDYYKTVEEQLDDIVDELRPIIPLRFERLLLEIHMSSKYAKKLYGEVKNEGRIKKDEWLNDGSWLCHLEIPAGRRPEVTDKLNGKTHGEVDIKVKDKKRRR